MAVEQAGRHVAVLPLLEPLGDECLGAFEMDDLHAGPPTNQDVAVALFERGAAKYRALLGTKPLNKPMSASLSTVSVWLFQLGIEVYHARPYQPQTLGKDERFHRTWQAELLAYAAFHDLPIL